MHDRFSHPIPGVGGAVKAFLGGHNFQSWPDILRHSFSWRLSGCRMTPGEAHLINKNWHVF